MSVTIVLGSFTDACKGYAYGENFLDLPEKIRNNLDDYFDGQQLNFSGDQNPDNLWINSFTELDQKETLVATAEMLTEDEFSRHVESGTLDEYIEENMNNIREKLEDWYVLGYENKTFYLI